MSRFNDNTPCGIFSQNLLGNVDRFYIIGICYTLVYSLINKQVYLPTRWRRQNFRSGEAYYSQKLTTFLVKFGKLICYGKTLQGSYILMSSGPILSLGLHLFPQKSLFTKLFCL